VHYLQKTLYIVFPLGGPGLAIMSMNEAWSGEIVIPHDFEESGSKITNPDWQLRDLFFPDL
jgi:hypothetical protein